MTKLVTYDISTSNLSNRIDRRAGYQGSRPSVCGQAEVETFVTGHHYSEVTSSGWLKSKRRRTQTTKKFHHSIGIGSIDTRTSKDPMKLGQCVSQCKLLQNDITFTLVHEIFAWALFSRSAPTRIYNMRELEWFAQLKVRENKIAPKLVLKKNGGARK